MTWGRVYLAGPITGLTYDEGNDWRAEAIEHLDWHGITAFSPLRAKEYLREYGALEGQYHDRHPLSSPKGITTRDRWDAMRCDVLLANFVGSQRVSIGTVMEIAWADSVRTPVVAALPPDDVHNHEMLKESIGFCLPTLEEALQVVVALVVSK